MADDSEEYDEKEAQRRYEQALRGAFKTPPTPMKDKPPVRRRASEKPTEKKRP